MEHKAPPPLRTTWRTKNCPNCGQDVLFESSYCPGCGTWMSVPPDALGSSGVAGLGCLALMFGSASTFSLLTILSSLLSAGKLSDVAPSDLAVWSIASLVAISCLRRIAEAVRVRRDNP